MSRFEYYQQCPRCLERGRDSRGDNLAVYSDGGKHCFSCNLHVFPKHYKPVKEKEILNAKVLPADFSREVPSHALQWLLQYNLPFSYWNPFIGWSERDERLVFTVGTGPEFSIGRFLHPPHTPYKDGAKQPRKWWVWGNSHRTPHIIGDTSKASQIVLVEDIISAHKVGQRVPSVCLFGTSVFPSCIPVLRFLKLPIVMWLDKDQEGTLQRKCNTLASMTNLPVRYITTKDDPKLHSVNQIEGVLNAIK